MEIFEIISLVVVFALGAALGAIGGFWLSPTHQKNRDLEDLLHDQQRDMGDYKQDVTDHFTKTAKLLEELEDNYNRVFSHLEQSAKELCKESSEYQPILRKLSHRLGVDHHEELGQVSPPLDYAPKSHPYEKGMLNEEYGLEKVNVSEGSANTREEEEPIAPPQTPAAAYAEKQA